MEGLTPITNLNLRYSPNFKEASNTLHSGMSKNNEDKLELSTKKKKKNQDYTEILAGLLAVSALATAGVWGGRNIYHKYFDKLACGIKKGEIGDPLYNFIKNNDPKGELFNNKNTILELNKDLTDEKLLLLKKLAKMKNSFSSGSYNRFKLNDIKKLLADATEENIQYIEQLASKKEEYGRPFNTEEINSIISLINKGNKKLAESLIEITETSEYSKNNINELKNCLKKINKDNIDIWQVLLSTRNRGGKTELNLQDLPDLANKLKETQNPKCAEILLNAQKKNGSGLYIHEPKTVIETLDYLKEENAELYRKFYELKASDEVSEENLKQILSNLNEHNIDLVETILTKKAKGKYSSDERVIFDDWNSIEEILKLINGDNKDTIKRLIDTIKTKDYHLVQQYELGKKYRACYKNPDEIIEDLATEFNKNPEKLKKAQEILDKGIVDGKQSLDFQAFLKKLNDF